VGGVALACALMAARAFARILDELNKMLPRTKQFGLLFGYPGFHLDVMEQHKVHFPETRQRRIVWACIFVGPSAAFCAALPWWYLELSSGRS
jgi:hypothetical protein